MPDLRRRDPRHLRLGQPSCDGFFCAIVGTLLSKESDDRKFAELEVRSLTEAGAH